MIDFLDHVRHDAALQARMYRTQRSLVSPETLAIFDAKWCEGQRSILPDTEYNVWLAEYTRLKNV